MCQVLLRVFAAVLITALQAMCSMAGAQEYPGKPVRLVVGLVPGGVVDLFTRALASDMSKTFGQGVIVENKPGAGGAIADEYIAKQVPPDGYNLLMSNSNMIGNQIFTKDMRYDPIKDLSHISVLVEGQTLMWTNTQTPFSSFAEFLAYTKANPGKLNIGAPGARSQPALMFEGMKQRLGLDFVIFPTKGTAETRVLVASNSIQIGMNDIGTSLQEINAGRGRPLAVTGNRRLAALPSVPTMAELGLGELFIPYWVGIAAPAATPGPVVSRIGSAVTSAMQTQEVRDVLAKAGLDSLGLNVDATNKRIASEVALFQGLAKIAGIKPQ